MTSCGNESTPEHEEKEEGTNNPQEETVEVEEESEFDTRLFGTWWLNGEKVRGLTFVEDGTVLGEGQNNMDGVAMKYITFDESDGTSLEIEFYEMGDHVYSDFRSYTVDTDTLFLSTMTVNGKTSEETVAATEIYIKD